MANCTCCNCIYAEYDATANNKWYCTWRKEHMRADESCYKGEPKR